ncbi:MAG: acyl-CoA dehydrogenase family protein [Ferrimicrobium sp.]
MDFAFSAEQEELRGTVRRFLVDRLPTSDIRAAMESGSVLDLDLWRGPATDLGLAGAVVSETHGGLGLSFTDVAVVLEEIGRGVAPLPFLSSSILAASLLAWLSDSDYSADLLSGIASGGEIVTIVSGSGSDICVTAANGVPRGSEVIVSGSSRFVLDGMVATTYLFITEIEGERSLVAVAAGEHSVQRSPKVTFDLTRPMAEVTASGARGVLVGGVGGFELVADRLHDLAAVSLALDMVGGASRAMEMSVDYAKNRVQFGRPIGSFQAIKHRCADMLVKVEGARSAAYYATWATDEDEAERSIAAPLAKAYCSDAYLWVAGATIQVHGGIGFTWEHDAHLYFKRAKSDAILFGDPQMQRARLAEAFGF